MNNLVAYDADSDDESPRRRSSEGLSANLANEEHKNKKNSERKRKDSEMFDDSDSSPRSNCSENNASNFAEPPPPKRVVSDQTPSPTAGRTPQESMPHSSSQASLVSYSGDGDEEMTIKNTPQSELQEPKPPVRNSQDDSDEEERLIDLALEEGKAVLCKMDEGVSPSRSETPVREGSIDEGSPGKSQGEADPDLANDDEIRIPSAPDVEVCERMQATFEAAFRQKSNGINLNQRMQSRQDFSNPMSYERFIDLFDIDEKGSNFEKKIFDPHCFPDNCFYDKIGEEQRKAMEAQQTMNAKKIAK